MTDARRLIDEDLFKAAYEKLYSVQKETVDNFFNNIIHQCNPDDPFIGKVILPTGTGKTKIAEYFAARFINDIYKRHGRPSVFAVACHRLMLANNLMGRIVSSVRNAFGVSNFKIVVVNSGKYSRFASSKYSDKEEAKKTWETYGLTNADIAYAKNLGPNLNKQVNAWINNGFNVLFVVLYHSMSTIKKSGVNFDFIFCDEAHITTEKNFATKIGDFVKMSNITIHFTATPTVTDDPNGGMNNREIYGDTIIFKKPVEVVCDKLITPVKVVLQELLDKDGNAKTKHEVGSLEHDNDVIDSIINGFKSLIKKCLRDQRKAGVPEKNLRMPVLFVSLSGGKIMDEFKDFESKVGGKFLQFRQEYNVDLYMTKSAKGFNGIVDYPEMNGLEYTNLPKEEFLDKMDLIETTRYGRGAIIINIDQLSEGIDLPAIDGVMIFRNLSNNPAKLLQIIGRSVRRANADRPLVTDPTVKYDDWDKFVKPYAYVYLPITTYDEITKKDVSNILMNLYNNYGEIIFRLLSLEDMEGNEKTVIRQADGMQNQDEEEMKRRYKVAASKEYIMNILDGEFNNKTNEEYLDEIAKMIATTEEKAKTNIEEKYKLEHLMNMYQNIGTSMSNTDFLIRVYNWMINNGFSNDEIQKSLETESK